MGMYDGQAASALMGGIKDGYKFVQEAEDASQMAKKRKLEMEKQVMENKLYKVASDKLLKGTATVEQQQIKEMRTQLDKQGKALTKQNGVTTSAEINDLATAPNVVTRDKVIQTTVARIKANPDAFAALGIKKPNSMRVLNMTNTADKKWLNQFLEAKGITPDELNYDVSTEEGMAKWDAVLEKSTDMLPLVNVDNSYVDLEGLGASVGSSVQASAAQREVMEKNKQYIQDTYGELFDATETNDYDVSPEGVPMGQAGVDALAKADEGNTIVNDGEATDDYKLDDNGVIKGQAGTELLEANQETDDELSKIARESRPADDVIATEEENTQAKEDVEATDIANSTSMEGITAFADSHETGGTKSYTAVNPKTKAYGRYQFMPKTMATLQKRLGLKKTSTPNKADQDAMYKELVDEHKGDLKSIGKEATAQNLYALHQLGGPVGKDYLKGNITPKVISSMKNQFSAKATKGKSDQEIVNMWENRFTKKGNTKVSNAVSTAMTKQNGTTGTAPLNDMRMRKIYALLGKTYPKDPNEPTAKIKNFEFLEPIVGTNSAFDAVWGKSKTGTAGRMQKAIEFRRTLEPGSQEYKDQTSYIEKLGRPGTASEYDFNQWKEEVIELESLENPTSQQLDRLEELNEKIRDSKDTASIQTSKDKVRTVKGVREDIETNFKKRLDEFYTKGTKLSDEDSGNLQDLQDELYEYVPSKTKERDTKTIDSMKANQTAGIEIDDVLKRFKPGGDLEKMEKGVVDNAVQWAETKLPKGMVSDSRKKTVEANIKAGSTLGYLQATLIKAMSGTAAAEAEVMRLQRVMQGDDWNQPEALKIALEEFYDHIKRQQGTLGKQLRTSPYDRYQLSDMESDRPDPSAKTETRRGKTADGRVVIQYSDGSTEVQ